MRNLGYCYFWGSGVKSDTIESIKWYKKAAELDNRVALWDLGWCYRLGNGVKKDSLESFKCFFKSAKLGDSDAMNEIGWCYIEGNGIEKNEGEAFYWFLKGAELDNREAMYGTAYCYIQGHGVNQDSTLAIKWLEKSAKLGYKTAQRQLGHIYENKGEYKKSFSYFEKAANQNDITALYNLGCFYAEGIGVKPDTIKAIQLWEKAANLGHVDAMHNLAVSYENGLGVEKNPIKAEYWYNREKGIETDSTSVKTPNKSDDVVTDTKTAQDLEKQYADSLEKAKKAFNNKNYSLVAQLVEKIKTELGESYFKRSEVTKLQNQIDRIYKDYLGKAEIANKSNKIDVALSYIKKIQSMGKDFSKRKRVMELNKEITSKLDLSSKLLFAESKGQWEIVRELAISGYVPACGSLAKHYLNERTAEAHCRAYHWALLSSTEAKEEVIKKLKSYGFLDEAGLPLLECNNIIY